ncbi:ubiquinol-cytochrome-c reductase complex assembly factor 3 isoform X2 [Nomascus leucogenys]|nr:ubiquinol-cytochrome-c reductase complex assembly factor 3 isoform X2 [Nomascus leucogenys]
MAALRRMLHLPSLMIGTCRPFAGRSSLREGVVRPRGNSLRLRGTPVGAPLSVQAAMDSLRKMLISVALLGAGAGVGSALLLIVTPGERRKQEMLKEMPLQDPRSREEAARTQQLLLATLQEAATTQENVAWRKNWMVGGEGGAGGRSQ